MGRIRALQVAGYRSLRDDIRITFPEKLPVVLVGENNSGKSNIVRALDFILGESWPGSHKPEDHEQFGRDAANGSIEIVAELSGVRCKDARIQDWVEKIIWKCKGTNQPTFSITLQQREESRYVTNEVRAQCVCIYISADRRLDYHLSYASKYTFLCKLMHKFHDRLIADPERVKELRKRFI